MYIDVLVYSGHGRGHGCVCLRPDSGTIRQEFALLCGDRTPSRGVQGLHSQGVAAQRTCTAGVLQHPLQRSTPPMWPSAPSAMYTPTETQAIVNRLQLCGSARTGANDRDRQRCLPNRWLVTPIVSPESGPALSTPWSPSTTT